MCCSCCIDTTIRMTNCNVYPSEKISEFARKINNGEASSWNYLWVVPINIATSLIGIILAPLACLVNLVAALLFKVAQCCSTGSNRDVLDTASKFALMLALGQLVEIPLLFCRVFDPQLKQNDPLSLNEYVYRESILERTRRLCLAHSICTAAAN